MHVTLDLALVCLTGAGGGGHDAEVRKKAKGHRY